MTKHLAILGVTAVLALTSACSGGDGQPAMTSAGVHCTGKAADCEEVGNCDAQAGCYTEIGIISRAYDTCNGDAIECKDIANQDGCNEQVGCTWH